MNFLRKLLCSHQYSNWEFKCGECFSDGTNTRTWVRYCVNCGKLDSITLNRPIGHKLSNNPFE